MKLILVFLLFLESKKADCDFNCPCPDLLTFYSGLPEWSVYESGVGCTQKLICTGKDIVAESITTTSNIPSSRNGTLFAFISDGTIEYANLPVISRDFYAELGLVGENKTWWITKFPNGVDGVVYIPTTDSNGKGYRAEVTGLSCTNF